MLQNFLTQYRAKLVTPEEAVGVVKSGDWVDYTSCLGKPVLLDRALSRRRDELYDVKIRGNLIAGPIETVECDESQEHFVYHCVIKGFVIIFLWYFKIMPHIISFS